MAPIPPQLRVQQSASTTAIKYSLGITISVQKRILRTISLPTEQTKSLYSPDTSPRSKNEIPSWSVDRCGGGITIALGCARGGRKGAGKTLSHVGPLALPVSGLRVVRAFLVLWLARYIL